MLKISSTKSVKKAGKKREGNVKVKGKGRKGKGKNEGETKEGTKGSERANELKEKGRMWKKSKKKVFLKKKILKIKKKF